MGKELSNDSAYALHGPYSLRGEVLTSVQSLSTAIRNTLPYTSLTTDPNAITLIIRTE